MSKDEHFHRFLAGVTALGVRVHVHRDLPNTETILHARSPSRARRRARAGHRQNMVTRPCFHSLVDQEGVFCVNEATYHALGPQHLMTEYSPFDRFRHIIEEAA